MFGQWTIKANGSGGFSIWNGRLLSFKDESELWIQLNGYGVTEEKFKGMLRQLGEKGEAEVDVHIPGEFRPPS